MQFHEVQHHMSRTAHFWYQAGPQPTSTPGRRGGQQLTGGSGGNLLKTKAKFYEQVKGFKPLKLF
jgi:hypothetical protein